VSQDAIVAGQVRCTVQVVNSCRARSSLGNDQRNDRHRASWFPMVLWRTIAQMLAAALEASESEISAI
jgi:hypothetical protein